MGRADEEMSLLRPWGKQQYWSCARRPQVRDCLHAVFPCDFLVFLYDSSPPLASLTSATGTMSFFHLIIRAINRA
jgi:hypothetical protein